MSLAQLSDLKPRLNSTQTTQDAFLQQLLDSISLQVERYTAKRFEPTPAWVGSPPMDTAQPVAVTVPVLPARGSSWQSWFGSAPSSYVTAGEAVVKIPHAREVDGVSIQPVLGGPVVILNASQYTLEADSTVQQTVYRRVVVTDVTLPPARTLTVTGRFGIYPVPADIADAVLLMSARRFYEKSAVYGDIVQMEDGAVVNFFKQFPASVRAIIDSYCEVMT